MKLFKISTIAATGIAVMLAGCSSKDDPVKPSGKDDDKVNISIADCEEITDKATLAIMEEAQSDIVEFMEAFGVGDFEKAQKKTSIIKDVYGNALKAHPANCEAQVGYALATVTNLINNKTLNDVIDSIKSIVEGPESGDNMDLDDVHVQSALYKLNANEAANLIVKTQVMAKETAQKVITDRLQDAIADEMIPAVDTAISYLKNIVDEQKFSMDFSIDDHTFTLDNGEFGPAVGALYVTRAVLTALASFNIDISKNGKYDWIDSLINFNEANYKDNIGVQYAVELLNADHPFGTVKKEWLTRYKNIPDDLEKAVDYVKAGFEYKLYEAENDLDQSKDLYVVGNDEEADMSIKDVQKVIDSLEYYKKGLHEPIVIKFNKDLSIKVNIGKFFELTSNVKKYAPYYEIVKPENWIQVDADAKWNTDLLGTYAAFQLESEAEQFLRSLPGSEYASSYIDDEDEDLRLSFNVDYENGSAYGSFAISIKNCKVSFTDADYTYYSYDDDGEEQDSIKIEDIVLSSDFCHVEDGVSLMAQAEGEIVPNVFNFTDKNGKVSASFTDFVNEKISVRDLKTVVMFPDYTFGGMFPEMTETKFWDLMDEYVLGDDDYDEEDD